MIELNALFINNPIEIISSPHWRKSYPHRIYKVHQGASRWGTACQPKLLFLSRWCSICIYFPRFSSFQRSPIGLLDQDLWRVSWRWKNFFFQWCCHLSFFHSHESPLLNLLPFWVSLHFLVTFFFSPSFFSFRSSWLACWVFPHFLHEIFARHQLILGKRDEVFHDQVLFWFHSQIIQSHLSAWLNFSEATMSLLLFQILPIALDTRCFLKIESYLLLVAPWRFSKILSTLYILKVYNYTEQYMIWLIIIPS